MMFRKLYWVTECVDASGNSHLLGVFTSIPNLLRQGLGDCVNLANLRLTLTRLDCCDGPIASWDARSFDRLDSDLAQFVSTDEFSQEHCQALAFRLSPVGSKK